jgi:hypothetical protein
MAVAIAQDAFLNRDKAASVITCFREVSFRLSQRLVLDLLAFRLLPKDVNIKVQKIAITCCLYGEQIWSLTLREERRLGVSNIEVLIRVFVPERKETV